MRSPGWMTGRFQLSFNSLSPACGDHEIIPLVHRDRRAGFEGEYGEPGLMAVFVLVPS